MTLARIETDEKEMGAQLAEQYVRATGGMREVLKFGAMMMMLRAFLVSKLDTSRLPTAKASDGGVKKWLEEHAQGVQRSTAYRFEDVAKAVAEKYQLPARVAKTLTFEELVTIPPDEIDGAAKKAQADLFAYVDGTSQTSWLDQYKAREGNRGGNGGSKKKATKKTAAEIVYEEAQVFWLPLQQKIFELVHSKAKKRLLHLPMTASPKEASLSILRNQVGTLGDLIEEAIKQRGKVAQ